MFFKFFSRENTKTSISDISIKKIQVFLPIKKHNKICLKSTYFYNKKTNFYLEKTKKIAKFDHRFWNVPKHKNTNIMDRIFYAIAALVCKLRGCSTFQDEK